jgi:hypothetical protein
MDYLPNHEFRQTGSALILLTRFGMRIRHMDVMGMALVWNIFSPEKPLHACVLNKFGCQTVPGVHHEVQNICQINRQT